MATIKAAAPWVISVHDAVISGGDLWVTVYRNVPGQDLTPYGGQASGFVYDSGVQEYDIKTGKLLYTWDALNPGGTPNIPLSEAEQPAPGAAAPAGTPWDAYHINSIQLLPGNEMLVSMRNTWAAYLINTKTNQRIWTLGGKASSFTSAANAGFAWQHDVRLLPHNQVSLFNDNCCEITGPGTFANPNGASGGLVLNLNTASHTVSLASSYTHKNPALAPAFLGSMKVLPNGNALVGWGSRPYFSEYSKSGQLLLDAIWPGKDLSYRAWFSSDWVGTPYFPPSGAARRAKGGKVTVYASWDGIHSGHGMEGPGRVQRQPSAGCRDARQERIRDGDQHPQGGQGLQGAGVRHQGAPVAHIEGVQRCASLSRRRPRPRATSAGTDSDLTGGGDTVRRVIARRRIHRNYQIQSACYRVRPCRRRGRALSSTTSEKEIDVLPAASAAVPRGCRRATSVVLVAAAAALCRRPSPRRRRR